MELCKMFIDGTWCEAASGKVRDLISATTGEVYAQAAEGGEEDLNRAVDAAERAFKEWRKTSTAQRAQILSRAAELVEERLDRIAEKECACTGQLIGTCKGDAGTVARVFRFYAGIVDLAAGQCYNTNPMLIGMTVLEPIGVVGVITPWNAPIDILSKAIAPALAAGNTVVVKPSSLTPLGTEEVIRCLADAGVPEGVVNMVLGSGATLGQRMGEHMKIGRIAFTGGTETGKNLIRASASNVKRLSMELGGKSPLLLFEDGDADVAIDNLMAMIYPYAGEICVAPSRFLVQDTIYDEVVEKITDQVSKIRVGQPTDPETEMGPLVSKSQMERVLNYIEIGKQEGARLTTGGYQLTGEAYERGNYVAPTVFADVTGSMRIAQEEIFGPVVVIEKFSTEEEAFEMANDSIYGLGAAIFTKDVNRSLRFGKEVKAACMWVNTYGPGAGFGPSVCCVKQSGYSTLMGIKCMESYMDSKSFVVMNEGIRFGAFRG